MGKQADEPHLNEDAYKVSGGAFAISDGASESFASGPWARLLVGRFVKNPAVDADWLADAVADYQSSFDRQSMSWSAQAAFDRGSFATLLGVQIASNGVSLLGIGDSLAVLDNGEAVLETFPYEEAEQFRSNPLLLSTIASKNEGILEGDLRAHWEIESGQTLFCMTDALGAWLLTDRHQRMAELRALRERKHFVALVENARAAGTMRRDDTTLLVIG
ncbi:PP2C family serine/threonine-protein phosphatase [Novosphingobium sp. BL-52-GroH]|uniref:PP2C family serine/threonine-protein phosphatase n=1 Tax=Novosphingobium sp. BL-52-GroH TaxID=3349877 RepID=UPI00384AE8F7